MEKIRQDSPQRRGGLREEKMILQKTTGQLKKLYFSLRSLRLYGEVLIQEER
jgi:hypothetical protein